MRKALLIESGRVHEPANDANDGCVDASSCLKLLTVFGLVLATAVLQPVPALAQPFIPPPVAPSQLERRFVEPQRPGAQPEPEIRQPSDAPSPADGKPLFVLSAIQVDGATVYSAADLAPLYAEFLAKEVSQRDLNEIARRITAKYRADGYVLSRAVVPVQRVEAGIMRIQVLEGFIDGTRIEGETRGDPAILQGYLAKIKASRPLRAAVLERYLLLANDLPGVSARAVLTPSPTVPGASDLALVVSQYRADGYASIDNRGTRYVGPYQIQAGAGLNSLQSRTRVRGITTSPTEELRYGELTHGMQLGGEGAVLTLAGRRTLSEPGFTLEPLDFKNDSTSGEIILSHPLVRTRRENLRISETFSYRDSKASILGSPFSKDRLSVVRFGGSYDFVDRFVGINLFGLEVSHGLDILGATETGSSLLSRSNGHSDFTKMTFQAQRLQHLANSWSLLGGVSGQVANNPLLVSEEFSVGGSEYGRAYDPSELTGDDGISAKIELRYSLASKPEGVLAGQLYGFYDVGKVRNREPVAGERARASLASAGFGIRFDLQGGVSASIEIAFPLTRPVAALGDDGSNPRIFFTLAKSVTRGLSP